MISIIVPVYNVEKYLKRCLNSIEQQTYNDWECIIVNDGSTDLSGEICREYANRDKRFRLINQENKGLSGARNKGLEVAKGEYLCFVDSDDWIEKDYIMLLLNKMSADEYDMVICGYYIVDKQRKNIELISDEKTSFKSNEFIHEIASGRIQCFAWNKMYKKSLFDEIKYKMGVYYEDIRIMGDLLSSIKNVGVVNIPLYNYYMRSDSIIHKKTKKKELDCFDAYKSLFYNDLILNDDKIIIIRNMMISYYYLVQISYIDALSERNYLNTIEKSFLRAAFQLMNGIEKARWILAYKLPVVYNLFFRFRK